VGIFIFAPVLFIIAFLFVKRLFQDAGTMESLKTDYLFWFSLLFFLAITSFFTWWGGWSYGPRYLTALAVLLVYEGLIFISKYDLSKTLFVALTGYGLLGAWLAKSTLVYMVPDYFLSREGFGNTFASLILPEVRTGRYNANNILSLCLNISPATSSFVWIFLFLSVTVGFAVWQRKLFAPGGAVRHYHGKGISGKNKKKKK
jgi:hypothetical protein